MNKSVSRYISLVFCWVENFDAKYFLVVKFQAQRHVFFWVRNIKLHLTPPPPPSSPSCIQRVPPWGYISSPDKKVHLKVANRTEFSVFLVGKKNKKDRVRLQFNLINVVIPLCSLISLLCLLAFSLQKKKKRKNSGTIQVTNIYT